MKRFQITAISLANILALLLGIPAYAFEVSKNAQRLSRSAGAATFESINRVQFQKDRLPPLLQQRQAKTALVIGNANYSEDSLSNPANDATDVAEALEQLGFEVTLLIDKDLRSMETALESFYQQLLKGGTGVFYYAGHGVQVEGENYLIPVDAKLARQDDVRYEALPLGKVLNAMEDSDTQVNILIVDACRDNPFYRKWPATQRNRRTRGLADVEIPSSGTAISFATRPGGIAEDGNGQRNSPYTSHLLNHIRTPDLGIVQLFRRIRQGVAEETNSRQVPWYHESLIGEEFSFNPAENQSRPVEEATNPSPSPEPTTPGAATPTPAPWIVPAPEPVTPVIATPTPSPLPPECTRQLHDKGHNFSVEHRLKC